MANLVQNKKIDQELFRKWAQENKIAYNKKLLKKLNSTLKKSIQDFFMALIANLDTKKKEEVRLFARSYLQENI